MECVFCKIVKGEISCKKVWEDENFIAIFDIKPLVEGHTVLFSKKHFNTILDVTNSLGSELLDAIKKTSSELVKKFNAEGFNLHANLNSVAGQLVPHFHLHILPRKENDGFRPCA